MEVKNVAILGAGNGGATAACEFTERGFNVWLYELPEWDGILTKEQRDEIRKRWRDDRTVRVEATPGRNDPCPCGSGKKYKQCCGR